MERVEQMWEKDRAVVTEWLDAVGALDAAGQRRERMTALIRQRRQRITGMTRRQETLARRASERRVLPSDPAARQRVSQLHRVGPALAQAQEEARDALASHDERVQTGAAALALATRRLVSQLPWAPRVTGRTATELRRMASADQGADRYRPRMVGRGGSIPP